MSANLGQGVGREPLAVEAKDKKGGQAISSSRGVAGCLTADSGLRG